MVDRVVVIIKQLTHDVRAEPHDYHEINHEEETFPIRRCSVCFVNTIVRILSGSCSGVHWKAIEIHNILPLVSECSEEKGRGEERRELDGRAI